MSEDTTVTILDLLNLSLGTPEIGAVNFNLLHRFLLELVKHFSLARKQVDITDDFSIQSALEETRMLSGTKSQSYFLTYSSPSEQAGSRRLSEVRARDSSTALDNGKRGTGSMSTLEKCDTPASGVQGKGSTTDIQAKTDEGENRKGQVIETTKSKESLRIKRSKDKMKNAEKTESCKDTAEKEMKSVDGKDTKEESKQNSPDMDKDAEQRITDMKKDTKQRSPVVKEDENQRDADEKEDKKQPSPDWIEDPNKRSPDEKAQFKAESPLSQRSPVLKSRTHSPQSAVNSLAGRSASSVTKESKRTSPSSSKTDVCKRSFVEVAIPGLCQLERKISILEAKFESLSAGPTNMEIVQQARDLQSRDSSTTAAGDMWQAMNLVRRIEVAEGAIDGITAMLDDISKQLNKMKENSLDGRVKDLSNKIEAMANLHKSSVMVSEVEGLQAKFSEMEKMLKNIAYKTDLKPYLTVKKMNDIMDYRLQNYRQLSPTVPKSPKKTTSSKLAQAEMVEANSRPAQMVRTVASSHPAQTATSETNSSEPTRPETTTLTTDSEQAQNESTTTTGEQAPTATATTSAQQASTESAIANNEQEAPNSTTATTPISEIAESEQTDNDDAQYAEIESVEAGSPLNIEEVKEGEERRASVTTEALEELYMTMHNWRDFREEAALKINDMEERLVNTVDKNVLMNLKHELSNLAEIQSTLKDEFNKLSEIQNGPQQPESVASQHLSQLETSVEGRLQALSKSLQDMKQNFFQLCEMKETIGNMKESEDHMKCDIENIRREILKVVKQLDDEQEVRNAFSRKRSFGAGDSEELHHIRSSLLEMKNEIEKHNTAMTQLVDDQSKKQLHLEALYGHVDQLDSVKADRQQINRDIEVKADRRDLETKVSEDTFHNSLSSLDQSVQDLVEKLVGHEATLKQAVNHITLDVNSKLDKMDMDTVKDYFEGKLKDLNSKVQRKPNEDKSQAAGSRCMLLHPANCISCDRPVHLYREGTKLPSLPFNKPLPHNKSNRPYMTFDLNDVRQKMYDVQTPRGKDQTESLGQAKVQNELLKLGAIKDGDEFAEVVNRPCGGNHTLTCPEKRTTIRVNKAYREDLHFIAQLSQKDLSIVDILGYDGHVYKGHVNHLPSIPEIPKNTMARRPTTGSGRPRTSSPI